MAETPLVYVVFDIVYFNGESLIKRSIKERKEILSNISFKEPIVNSIYKLVNSEEDIIIAMFEKSRDIGHEGLVLKDPVIVLRASLYAKAVDVFSPPLRLSIPRSIRFELLLV
jgi:ATP-dependent DNA ligase